MKNFVIAAKGVAALLCWQVDDSYHNYFFLTAFGMQLFGPDMDDFKMPGFDSDGARRGVEFHKSLRQYYNVNTADATWDSTVAAFQRGEGLPALFT
jgi:arabinogalactan oligomer/maltooligosaccharide transport system substrate-binding protein